jgi:PRTRC genetic system protein B
MNNITHAFGSLFHPEKAFLIYKQRNNASTDKIYIESYDIAPDGSPMNAHPLSLREAGELAKALQNKEDKKLGFLKPAGLLPKNLLYLNSGTDAYAIWYTPKQKASLLFSKNLDIPCGNANIPPLIWKASRDTLAIYAITDSEDISGATLLHNAPFFNIYRDGKVCMGNVKINIPANCPLESFISLWQEAFFNSYFSHMIQSHNPVKGNLVLLWKSLVGTRKQFPINSLIPLKSTLKNLIS